jgi:hypothetical protein
MKTFFKEILRTLTYRSVFLLSLPMLMLAAPSCEKSDEPDPTALKAPVLTAGETTDTSLEVRWEAVERAAHYEWEFNGTSGETTNHSFFASDLTPSTSYTLRVRACPAAENKSLLPSEWSEITLTTGERRLEDVLSIKILHISDIGVQVESSSTQTEETYYLRISPADQVDGRSNEEIRAADRAFFEEEARTLGFTLSEYLDLRLDKGTTVTTSGALSPNSAYCVYGYGMRNDGTVTSNLVRKSFRTLSNETPQIAITLGTIESTSFAPQDGDIEYAALLRPAAAYLELGDEECLKKLVEEGIDGTLLLKGDATRTFDMLTPDTEYLLFAFGYDAESQQAFTSLSRKVFKSAREFSELTVEITVEDITPETAQVAFIPSDKNATYFYSVEPAHQFEGLTDEEFIARAVANAKASGLLSFYLTSGDEAYRQDLYPDMDYVAFAFGFEYGSMQVTTGLFRNEFRSGHLDVPELGIDIKVSNLTSDTATVTFTPTNDEAYYFSYVAPSAELAGLDDDAMIEKALSLPGYALAFVDCGTLDFDAELSPGTEYTAIAFGYEHDMPTTKPFTLTFTSPEWEDPSQLFKISHSNLTSDSADIHVIPADKQMRYFSDLKLSSDYEGLTEEEITRKMIDEAWYISLYIHYGILDEPFSGLQADTEYTYFIFGYDSDTGTRTTPVTSYRIRTAAQ